MDMEYEMNNNALYYKYSENGIKKRNNLLYEEILNYNDNEISFKEKFYLYENNLKHPPTCECGNKLKFIDMKNGYRTFCSKKCQANNKTIQNKRKNTNIKKYGYDNPSKSEKIKNKVKSSNRIKFGVDYATQNENIKKKTKEYFVKKFGVDNPSKIPSIRDKARKTTLEKYGVEYAAQNENIKKKTKEYFVKKFGVDNPSKIPSIRDKARKTTLEKYGVEYVTQDPKILKEIQNSILEKYGKKFYTQTEEYKNTIKKYNLNKIKTIINNENYELIDFEEQEYTIHHRKCDQFFTIQKQLYRKRIQNDETICLKCNPIQSNTSKSEKEILQFIQSIYPGEIIENYRNDNKEIDIYLPNMNFGLEYNGLYWHSELHKKKSYHYEKYKHFKNKNIELLQIWEDEWLFKKNIIKSIIKNKLNLSIKIGARKCDIREIEDNKLVRSFLNENHIQGFVGSKIKIGLFYKDELVSLMTFGKLRKSLGQEKNDENFELIRFANKNDISITGGASKLFKFFVNKYHFNVILSYSDNSKFTGNLYKSLGFKKIKQTDINYFWVKNKIKHHRFNFRKDKLVKMGYDENKTETEIMHGKQYFKIYDSGSIKWEYPNQNSI